MPMAGGATSPASLTVQSLLSCCDGSEQCTIPGCTTWRWTRRRRRPRRAPLQFCAGWAQGRRLRSPPSLPVDELVEVAGQPTGFEVEEAGPRRRDGDADHL